LASVEYLRATFDRLDQLAEPLDGPSYEIWRQVAREFETCVAFSFPRRTDDGYCITLAVAGPEGDLIGHYDKIHLAQFGASMEREHFQSGADLFVFRVSGFRVAPIICADIRIPELSRTLAVEGDVDVILHSGAYFRDPTFYSWHSFVITRALENQVFFLSLNRAGKDYGKSVMCPPWADENRRPFTFDEHREQLQRLVTERDEIARARERYSFLKDRRESYRLPFADSP
jgi:predicted amidohydrolase